MTIASPARTARIIEEVAAKHHLAVATLICTARRRDVVLARGELVYRLKTELDLSFFQIATKLGTVPSRVHSLLTELKKRQAQERVLAPPLDAEGRIRELEAELAKLSGSMLCERLAAMLRLRLRCAIGLSILTEAYPRVVRGPALLQLYDDACARLGYGYADGVNYRLLDKNMSQLNSHFLSEGWPVPAICGDGRGARQLSDDAAEWMSVACGAPRRSVVLAVREAMSDGGSHSPLVRLDRAL